MSSLAGGRAGSEEGGTWERPGSLGAAGPVRPSPPVPAHIPQLPVGSHSFCFATVILFYFVPCKEWE